jgi:hypothetical protein
MAVVSAFVGNRIGAAADWDAMSTYLVTFAIGFPLGVPAAVWAGWFAPPSRRVGEPPQHVG